MIQRLSTIQAYKNPNFIGEWQIEPVSICTKLIDYFEKNTLQQSKGSSVTGVNTDVKDSIDISKISNDSSKLNDHKKTIRLTINQRVSEK